MPFGFRVEQIKMDEISTSRYQPVKEEIRWVKEMFSFYAQQEASLGELAQYLKELGAVNRQGKAFGIQEKEDAICTKRKRALKRL